MASSADDVIGKVAETLKNSLLVAIGAVSSSPTQAVKTCQELGLSNEEEKLAKWVAILKRDSQELFGKDFLSILKEIYEKEGKEMSNRKEEKNILKYEGLTIADKEIKHFAYFKAKVDLYKIAFGHLPDSIESRYDRDPMFQFLQTAKHSRSKTIMKWYYRVKESAEMLKKVACQFKNQLAFIRAKQAMERREANEFAFETISPGGVTYWDVSTLRDLGVKIFLKS